MYRKKGFLRIFAKFTEKHLCQSLFLNKVAVLRPAILLKKRLWYRCFPENFAKFLRTPFFIEYLRWHKRIISQTKNKFTNKELFSPTVNLLSKFFHQGNRSHVFYKKNFLKNFAGVFLNKVAGSELRIWRHFSEYLL